jgi:hypothetical protein
MSDAVHDQRQDKSPSIRPLWLLLLIPPVVAAAASAAAVVIILVGFAVD